MTADIFEEIQVYLPKYLTPTQKRELFSELERFPTNTNFYLSVDPAEHLQGDGWRGLVVINFETLEKKAISGVILSNSCDIDPTNPRALDVSVLFSPLIRLSAYAKRLKDAEKTDEQIENILRDIRRQTLTYAFYLPPKFGIIEESLILLDNIHSHPLRDFTSRADRTKLFTLSQYAFYILLIKLSIHFSRFQEGVARSDASPAPTGT
jgi:hypothetical protein